MRTAEECGDQHLAERLKFMAEDLFSKAKHSDEGAPEGALKALHQLPKSRLRRYQNTSLRGVLNLLYSLTYSPYPIGTAD
jgi:hypothetical protein